MYNIPSKKKTDRKRTGVRTILQLYRNMNHAEVIYEIHEPCTMQIPSKDNNIDYRN